MLCTNRVVEHPVEVSFIRIELHCPSVHVARSIGRSRFEPNRGHTLENWGSFSSFVEETGAGEVGAITSGFKLAVASTACQLDSTYDG